MESVLLWFIRSISQLVNVCLSWKIIAGFSLLHILLGALLLITILNLISFGAINIGGTADYVGGIRRTRNRENARDRRSYVYYNKNSSHNVVHKKSNSFNYYEVRE